MTYDQFKHELKALVWTAKCQDVRAFIDAHYQEVADTLSDRQRAVFNSMLNIITCSDDFTDK